MQYLPIRPNLELNNWPKQLLGSLPLDIVLLNGTAPLKNVNNCWNTDISFYLETSSGQNSNLYLNVVHFFNTSVN
jgi:hypothetical protein